MKAVIRTSTAKLNVGDVLQHGNIFDGFTYTTVKDLIKSGHNNMLQVIEQYNHGGTAATWHGKNAIWYVQKVGA